LIINNLSSSLFIRFCANFLTLFSQTLFQDCFFFKKSQKTMRKIIPPEPIEISPSEKSVFLAGSIELGQVEDWQTHLIKRLELANWQGVVLNPRRETWDSSWVQSIDNEMFKEQVDWELSAMEQADWIVYYFHPQTQAPITLLELGLHAHQPKALVCCPAGYWRKGNVDIVCERYGLKQVPDLEAIIQFINLEIG
jgi:hypothetical protein